MERIAGKSLGMRFLWDRLKGNSLETKKRLILENRLSHNKKALEKVFSKSFTEAEISIIQSVVGIDVGFNPPAVENLDEMLFNLSALAKINRRFLIGLLFLRLMSVTQIGNRWISCVYD